MHDCMDVWLHGVMGNWGNGARILLSEAVEKFNNPPKAEVETVDAETADSQDRDR